MIEDELRLIISIAGFCPLARIYSVMLIGYVILLGLLCVQVIE